MRRVRVGGRRHRLDVRRRALRASRRAGRRPCADENLAAATFTTLKPLGVWAVETGQARQSRFASGLDDALRPIAGTIGLKATPKMTKTAKPQPPVFLPPRLLSQIGRASCRERVWQ